MSTSKALLWFSTVFAIVVVLESLKNVRGPPDLIKRFPYLVGLAAGGRGTVNETVCSGTLVAATFVLTSAHCTSLLQTQKIKVISRKSATAIKTRMAVKVYTHPSYDSRLRLFDLSLVKLKRPFRHVRRFAKLSSKTFNRDEDMDCVVVGIGATDKRLYKVPVRAKYGRFACEIPKSNPTLKYILGYTWTDFMCTHSVGPPFTRLPCGRADPLLCDRDRRLYGMSSYGYGVESDDPADCGDPTVQGRSAFVNKHYKWIADTLSATTDGTLSAMTDDTLSATPDDKLSTTPDDKLSTTPDDKLSTTPENKVSTKPDDTLSATPDDEMSGTPDDEMSGTPEDKVLAAPSSRVGSARNGFRGPPDEDRYPYLAHLQGLADEPTCGGTLVSPYHVLTSAYCTTRMTDIHVTAADRHRELYTDADVVYVHPDFDVKTLVADVSVVVLRDPFNVSEYAQLADFPDPSDADGPAVMSCTVVARMPTAQYHYRASVRAKYGPRACRNTSVVENQKYIDQTRREFICGLYENRLKEDTGSPLICDRKQYGVTSHGYQIEHGNPRIAEQTRFLAVKNYRRWIERVVRLGGVNPREEPASGSGARSPGRCGLVTAAVVLFLPGVFLPRR